MHFFIVNLEPPSAAAAVREKKNETEGILKMILMTGVPAFFALVFLVCLIAVVACRRNKKKLANGELNIEMRERADRNGVTRGRGSTRYSAPTEPVAADGSKRCSCQSSDSQKVHRGSLPRGNEYTRAPKTAECCPLVYNEGNWVILSSRMTTAIVVTAM